MTDIGFLLKYLGEYICENELLKRCMRPWALRMDEYLTAHAAEKITLKTFPGISVNPYHSSRTASRRNSECH